MENIFHLRFTSVVMIVLGLGIHVGLITNSRVQYVSHSTLHFYRVQS